MQILEISQTAPTETSRSARNVKDTCWPIVTCFSNIQRTYKNMDVHSVHNASCLYVHVWAQERDKEVNYACRCRVAQSTAKHLFSDFQTENTTHEFDMAKNHCRRDLQTEGWTHQQKTSLTKLGNNKLSSSATPSCIISQCLCIRSSTASDDADDAVACSIRTDIPFAQTFSSANETATTKRPQTSRVRDFKQTFCIQKFRDMHICSLAFKTMPWHAWFQNKIERYKIERYNDSRSIFCPLLMHFNENITYIFLVLYIT